MNFESPTPALDQKVTQNQSIQPDPGTTIKNLEQGFRTLGYQLMVVLVLVTILNISVNVYLWKQLSMIRRQAIEMNAIVTEYELRGAPKMNDFVEKLKTFGKANPDFNAAFSKYWTNTPSVVMPPIAPVIKK
jgi:hypothetical protein